MTKSDDVHFPTWAIQGLQLLGEKKRENAVFVLDSACVIGNDNNSPMAKVKFAVQASL